MLISDMAFDWASLWYCHRLQWEDGITTRFWLTSDLSPPLRSSSELRTSKPSRAMSLYDGLGVDTAPKKDTAPDTKKPDVCTFQYCTSTEFVFSYNCTACRPKSTLTTSPFLSSPRSDSDEIVHSRHRYLWQFCLGRVFFHLFEFLSFIWNIAQLEKRCLQWYGLPNNIATAQ